MTADELADFLAAVGVVRRARARRRRLRRRCTSSSEGGVVSSPSDGVERPVANHLGVRYGASPYRFSVVGLVFDTDLRRHAKLITNATVVVDGVTATWHEQPHALSASTTSRRTTSARTPPRPATRRGTQCRADHRQPTCSRNGPTCSTCRWCCTPAPIRRPTWRRRPISRTARAICARPTISRRRRTTLAGDGADSAIWRLQLSSPDAAAQTSGLMRSWLVVFLGAAALLFRRRA